MQFVIVLAYITYNLLELDNVDGMVQERYHFSERFLVDNFIPSKLKKEECMLCKCYKECHASQNMIFDETSICKPYWDSISCPDIDRCSCCRDLALYPACQNAGQCINTGHGSYNCKCQPGSYGHKCEHIGQPTTCSRTCILRSLAFQQSVKSANAATCPNSSSFGSNEALPMQCCQTQTSSTWIKGQHVMPQCNSGTMTPYTTVAIFRPDGMLEPNTAGILTECLSGGAGFSIVRQDCTSFPTVIHVNGTAVGQVDNNPNHYSIVL